MMLDHDIDKIISESINRHLSHKIEENVAYPCKQLGICKECGQKSSVRSSVEDTDRSVETVALNRDGETSPHEGRCFPGQIVHDIMEIISKFKVSGGSSCRSHPLHEASYQCINCNDGGLICLICFAENHVGHVIRHTSRPDASMPTAKKGVKNRNRVVQFTATNDDPTESASRRNSRLPTDDCNQDGQEHQESAPQHSMPNNGKSKQSTRQDVESDNSNEDKDKDADSNYEDNESGDDDMRSVDEESEPDLSRFTEKLVQIGVDPVRMPIKEENVKTADVKSRAKKKSTEKSKSKPTFKCFEEVTRCSRAQRKRPSELNQEDDEDEENYPKYTRKETAADLERENKWDQHFFALLTYGEEHKTEDGRSNFNVPRDYVCGEGDDKLLLGAWVNRLDFRCMSEERHELLSTLMEGGDFSICFKDRKKQTAQVNGGTSSSSSSSSSSKSSSSSQSQSKGKETQGGTSSNGTNQLQRQLMRIKSEASASSPTKIASTTSTVTKTTAQEQQQQQSSFPRQNKSHDQTSSQSQSQSSKNQSATQQPNNETDNSTTASTSSPSVRIWRSLMPTPSDLKSRTCIVHYQKKKSKPSGELKRVVVFGQVKEDVGEDCTAFSPIWKVGTNAMEALDLSDLSNSGFKIIINAKSQRDVKVGDILLHGLILAEGDSHAPRRFTPESRSVIETFIKNNKANGLNFEK